MLTMRKKGFSVFLALIMCLQLLGAIPALAEPALVETRIDDNTIGTGLNQFSYSGPWGLDSGYPQYYYQGTAHWSNAKNWPSAGGHENVYFTVKFKGVKFALYGDRQPGLGIYDIILDGEKIGTADAYGSPTQRSVMLFESGMLSDGEHTLKVAATNTKNPASSAPDMLVDYLSVWNYSASTEGELSWHTDTVTLESGSVFYPALDNGLTGDDRTVTYESSDPDTAGVAFNETSKNIELTAKRPGKAVITARANGNGEITAALTVDVIEPAAWKSWTVDDTDVGDGDCQFSYYNWSGCDMRLSGASYPYVYKGTGHYGTNAASYCTFKFTGSKFELISKKGSSLATLDILVDGKLLGRVNPYNASTIFGGQSVFTSPVLDDGEHLVEIRNSGGGSATEIYIDAMKVYRASYGAEDISLLSSLTLKAGDTYALSVKPEPAWAEPDSGLFASDNEQVVGVNDEGLLTAVSPGVANVSVTLTIDGEDIVKTVPVAVIAKTPETWKDTLINDGDVGAECNQFVYGSTWTRTNSSSSLGGTVSTIASNNWSGWNKNACYATLTFSGQQVELYGRKGASFGVYDLYLDGQFAARVDAYASSTQNGALLYASPILSEGLHTLTVKPTYEKNASAAASARNQFDMAIEGAVVRGNPIMPESILIQPSELSLDQWKESMLGVVIEPAYATEKAVTWTSSDPSVASVSDSGAVAALAPGSAVIRATSQADPSVYGECVVTIYASGPVGASFASAGKKYGVRNQDEEVSMDYYEVADMSGLLWEDTGWKGDTLSTQLLAWSKSVGVQDVSIVAGSLRSGAGDTIDASNVELGLLQYVRSNKGRNSPASRPYEYTPEIIAVPASIAEVPSMAARTVQSVWLNVNIPGNAKAGLYTGVITVTAADAEPIELNVSVEVLDALQPEVQDNEFHLDLWQYPYTVARYYGVEPWSEEHFKYLKGQMETYRDAGGQVITTTIVENPWGDSSFGQQTYDYYPSMVKWTKKADGAFVFDYTDFDKWVQFNLDLGIDKQINCFSMLPWNNRYIYFDEAQNKDVTVTLTPAATGTWADTWRQLLRSLVDHLEEKGWLDIAYIATDERPIANMALAVDLAKSVEASDGRTLKFSSAMNYSSLGSAVLDRIEDISIGISYVSDVGTELQDVTARRRELGLNTTIYSCTGDYPNLFARSWPAEAAWIMWYTQKFGVNGYMRWAYDAWVADPLVCTDHWYWESGDAFQIYPAAKDSGSCAPQSSPRFEMLRQGIRDVEKLNYIKRAAPEFTDEINALYDTLNMYPGYTNSWGAREGNYGEDMNSDLLRLRGELMDITRRFIAGQKTEKITSVEVTTPSIVETLAANLHVSVTGENLEGRTLTAYLSVDGELLYPTDITSGTAVIKVDRAPKLGSDCAVVVKVDGSDACGKVAITLLAYNPETLWKPSLVINEDGFIAVRFAQDIGPAPKTGYSAAVNGAACGFIQESRTIVTDILARDVSGDVTVLLSGVMYPVLFPSYSFTFTVRGVI